MPGGHNLVIKLGLQLVALDDVILHLHEARHIPSAVDVSSGKPISPLSCQEHNGVTRHFHCVDVYCLPLLAMRGPVVVPKHLLEWISWDWKAPRRQ